MFAASAAFCAASAAGSFALAAAVVTKRVMACWRAARRFDATCVALLSLELELELELPWLKAFGKRLNSNNKNIK